MVTWPKTRPLESYLSELEKAHARGLHVNYRIARPPRSGSLDGEDRRLYRVHDDQVRGCTRIVGARWQPEGRVLDPVTGTFWRAGYYIVCDPEWWALTPTIPMRGFQGWRWLERPSP